MFDDPFPPQTLQNWKTKFEGEDAKNADTERKRKERKEKTEQRKVKKSKKKSSIINIEYHAERIKR